MPWIDLNRLEVKCQVVLRSYLHTDMRPAWRMTITPRSARAPAMPSHIVIEARDLQEVLAKGVAEAQRMGMMSE